MTEAELLKRIAAADGDCALGSRSVSASQLDAYGFTPNDHDPGVSTKSEVGKVTSGAVICLGAPRPNFLCRSTREELERECIPLRTTHVTGYGRCEQLFTLFFADQ